MTRDEMSARGWQALDVLLITGDAYFDHPSHGAAVIGRVLEAHGYRVGIIARPDWRNLADFERLGRPALFAGVTAGAVDSAVNNHTAHMARRRVDAYAPGGAAGGRPDMATLVYANRIREAYPKLPVILGGIEASLQRFAFYDTIRQSIRRSLLVDSRANLLVYGPGEAQVLAIAGRLAAGRSLSGIAGTARLHRGSDRAHEEAGVALPDFDDLTRDPALLITQMRRLELGSRPGSRAVFFQRYPEGVVIAEPPGLGNARDLEQGFSLPFARAVHPSHVGPVPAFETVRWSIISHRGCPGGCSFCGLATHQGREIHSRAPAAILEEAARIARTPGFPGTITDVGGPTANAFGIRRRDPTRCEGCGRASCLYPGICANLEVTAEPLLRLLDEIRARTAVRHLFLASGIRHDLALETPELIDAVARHYTGGHLKVAPEHVAPSVLALMRKPDVALFEQFERLFSKASRACGKEQYIVPYFIAGFVGCGSGEAAALQAWLAKRGQRLRQAQTFIPLAGTAAAAMFAAGRDMAGQSIDVPDLRERRRQKRAMTGEGAPRARGPAPLRPRPKRRGRPR